MRAIIVLLRCPRQFYKKVCVHLVAGNRHDPNLAISQTILSRVYNFFESSVIQYIIHGLFSNKADVDVNVKLKNNSQS